MTLKPRTLAAPLLAVHLACAGMMKSPSPESRAPSTAAAETVADNTTSTRPSTVPAPQRDEGKSATTNAPGEAYPKIDDGRRATFHVHAPDAKRVRVSVGNTYDMIKGENGDWAVTTRPLVPGFHYYWLIIDGVNAPDLSSESFFGIGRMYSGIEVPEKGTDFYDAKVVPHGEIRALYYPSASTHTTRRCFVYTPPGYDTSGSQKFPVLYLQHGYGEDERGWSTQGRMNFILDNLIAAGKAKPMIVVMENGGIAAYRPRELRPGNRPVSAPAGTSSTSPATTLAAGNSGPMVGEAFGKILLDETIPMIESRFRTYNDREHRAMAGLSMGGMQTFQITLPHLDQFAYIGGFSSAGGQLPDLKTAYGGAMGDADAFNKRVKVLYISIGTAEGDRLTGARNFHQGLEQAGIKHTYFESPGTAHEWQTWRRSLYGFARLLFQE